MIKQTTINKKNKNRKNPENSPTNHPRVVFDFDFNYE